MSLSEKIDRGYTVPRLLEALAHDHFILYGQVIMPVAAPPEPAGYVEVLVRYIEEEQTHLPPGGFFDVLEGLNLMSMLDRWVLNRVVRSMVERHQAQNDWSVPCYSINLSVDSLYENEFPNLVREYFRKYGLPRGRLRFEVDEPDAHVHRDEFAKLMASLVPVGCGFTVSSYSGESLPPEALQALGVNAVKMEGARLMDAAPGAAASNAGEPLHLRCKSRGIRVIADFIEEREALDRLKGLRVDYVQGYAICRPAPLQSLQKALK